MSDVIADLAAERVFHSLLPKSFDEAAKEIERLEEEEEEAGRRIREAMEGETGDLMRLALRIGTLLVEKEDGTMGEGS